MLVCPKHSHFIDGKTIAFDTETTGTDVWRGDRAFAFSFANEADDKVCFEFDVDPFTRAVIPKPRILEEIRALMADTSIRKVGFNTKFDVRMLHEGWGIPVLGRLEDVMWKAHVCNSSEHKHALKPLADKYAQIPSDDEEELGNAVKACRLQVKKLGWKIAKGDTSGEDKKAFKADYWIGRAVVKHAPQKMRDSLLDRWPNLAHLCSIYALLDAIRTLVLNGGYDGVLNDEDLWRPYERELRMFPVTYRTEKTGVRVFPERCAEVTKECDTNLVRLRSSLSKIFGDFKTEVPDAKVRRYLFAPKTETLLGPGSEKCLELPIIKRTDGGKSKIKMPSVDKDVKDFYSHVPIVRDLKDFDKYHKAKSHYIEKYERHAIEDFTGIALNVLVVNCRQQPYDVYIGRGNCPRTGKMGEWGNPFHIGKDGDREEVIRKYESWLRSRPSLVARARIELKNKVLGCYCAPQACHGHVLARIANAQLIVHADFKQLLAITARMACANPPLQQTPKRAKKGEIMKRVRYPFGPRKRKVWVHYDYKSIEPRVLAEEAEEEDIIRIFNEGGDPYLVLVDRVSEATKWSLEELEGMFEARGGARQVCKNNFLGWTYGEGVKKLAAQMGCTLEVAFQIISALQSAFGGVGPFMKYMQQLAKRDGCIRNRYGRKAVIPPPARVLDEDGNWVWAEFWYKATNYLIQGTAADLLKEAAIRLSGEDIYYDRQCRPQPAKAGYLKGTGAEIVMFIHDELIVEMPFRLALNEKFVRGVGDVMADNEGMFKRVTTPVDGKVTYHAWSDPDDLETLWS